jgi:hypothetical protein
MTPTADPGPDPVLALLARERSAFLAQLARVPAECRALRPAPDRWSAAEVVEHVARIDRGVAMILSLRAGEGPSAAPESLGGAQLTAERAAVVRDRARRLEAPERVRPTGALSPAAALEQLTEARASLAAAYLAADAAVLDGAVHPHPLLGPITVRGWFELAAHHDARHAQQLAELAEAFGGPPGAPVA